MHQLKTQMTSTGALVVTGIGTGIETSQLLISADRFSIKSVEQFLATEYADLLERRLARIESKLGFSPLGDR